MYSGWATGFLDVAIGIGQFEIHAGLDGEETGTGLILGDKMAMSFGAVV